MRISTEALPKDIDSAVNWISGLIGAAIDKRVAGFERQEGTNPLLASHFRENFALEFALARARKYRRSTGRLLTLIDPDEIKIALGEADAIVGPSALNDTDQILGK
jgi:hypothetical protein